MMGIAFRNVSDVFALKNTPPSVAPLKVQPLKALSFRVDGAPEMFEKTAISPTNDAERNVVVEAVLSAYHATEGEAPVVAKRINPNWPFDELIVNAH